MFNISISIGLKSPTLVRLCYTSWPKLLGRLQSVGAVSYVLAQNSKSLVLACSIANVANMTISFDCEATNKDWGWVTSPPVCRCWIAVTEHAGHFLGNNLLLFSLVFLPPPSSVSSFTLYFTSQQILSSSSPFPPASLPFFPNDKHVAPVMEEVRMKT